jgi:AcrR family transcriptional regulator
VAVRRKKQASTQAARGRGQYDRTLSKGERHAQQHALLVQAAGLVFAEVGFAAATVEDIVSRAAMSRRTFYEHFTDLKGVLLEVHASLAGQAFTFLELALGAIDDPLEQIRVGALTFFGLIAGNGSLARVIFREVRLAGPEFEARWEFETMRYVTLMTQALSLAHQRGLLGRAPDESLVFALIAGAEAVAMRHLARGEEAQLVEIAPRIAELILRAFR